MNTLSKITKKVSESGFKGLLASGLHKVADRVDGDRYRQQSPPNHQLLAHRVLSRYTSFLGKTVLEVGGSQSCESAYPFLRDGAKKVSVTGLDHIDDARADLPSAIEMLKLDALRLTTVFEPESFDVVYGLSIVEHIPSPNTFLEEVYQVLKPGGIAFFEGSPLWSSPKGHHIYLSTSAHLTAANYFFEPSPGTESTNPLPDWSHLLMTPEQMKQFLLENYLPEFDISLIIDWVYYNNVLNRLSLSEIARAYTNSKLTTLEANTSRINVPNKVRVALREKYGDSDYGTISISYVLAKM